MGKVTRPRDQHLGEALGHVRSVSVTGPYTKRKKNYHPPTAYYMILLTGQPDNQGREPGRKAVAFQCDKGIPSIPENRQGYMQEREGTKTLWYLQWPRPPGDLRGLS